MKTYLTIPNNKPDVIIRDEERNLSVNRHCNMRRQKCDRERWQRVLKMRQYNRNTAYLECKRQK